jgi:hypothetical protein
MSGKFESFIAEMPRLGETDGVPFDDKEVWLHFFCGESHWMAVESDGHGLFYDCIVLDGDSPRAKSLALTSQRSKRASLSPSGVTCGNVTLSLALPTAPPS